MRKAGTVPRRNEDSLKNPAASSAAVEVLESRRLLSAEVNSLPMPQWDRLPAEYVMPPSLATKANSVPVTFQPKAVHHAVAGQSLTAVLAVAKNLDPTQAFPTASIDWGDGSAAVPVDLTVGPRHPSIGHVLSWHTYANDGTFEVTIRLISGSQIIRSVTTIVNVRGVLQATAGRPFKQVLGVVPSSIPPSVSAGWELSFFIDWGDSSSGTPNTVSKGAFEAIKGTHRYTHPGTYAVRVDVSLAPPPGMGVRNFGGTLFTSTIYVTSP